MNVEHDRAIFDSRVGVLAVGKPNTNGLAPLDQHTLDRSAQVDLGAVLAGHIGHGV
jgi:hypothetical protein